MKNRKANIISRFAALIFGLITVLGIFFILITYTVITHYHDASTQLLNKEVAAHIAKFASPFEGGGFDKKRADSVFYNAMVLSPAAEVYFLDTTGKIIAYHADGVELKSQNISPEPLKKYIRNKGEKYIKGADPRDPANDKIFSAAAVLKGTENDGYIYVILNSKKSEGIMDLLFGNHILNLAVTSFVVVIALSLIFSLLYLRRISRNYRKFIIVLDRFEKGDYSARFNFRKENELEPVTAAFNRMADLLSSSISRLTVSEQERKNFIATISHDLRTPLAIARGYSETLMMSAASAPIRPEDREKYSGLIYNKLLQIEDMVKQLFELSKMDAVAFRPNKEPFVFSEILQEAVNSFQLIAAEKGLAIACNLCLDHVWIDADVSMMERVVQNLLENAVKGTAKGGDISVWLDVADNHLLMNIENTGDPLPPALTEWINSSPDGLTFFSSRPLGAGLGLIIVQRILNLHGSSLKTASPGGLNRFSFELPIYKKTEQ